MDLHLEGKVAVITGGSAGIGKAAALQFAREGCKLAICGRSEERLAAAAAELRALGAEVYTHAVDVAELPALQGFVAAVCAHFGQIDIWVNNAGTSQAKSVLSYTPDEWDHTMDLNLKSLFFASQYAARHMVERNAPGVIINISSFTSVIPTAFSAIYSASKAAVNSLTRTFAAELAPHSIRVVGVIPGMIETEMTQSRISQNRSALTTPIAAGRLGTPQDLAKPIVFLASPACGYITGTTLEISGGKFSVQNPGAPWQNT